MTVREFLKTETKVRELCAIFDSGWIAAFVYVDFEDLCMQSLVPRILDAQVIDDKWDDWPLIDQFGDRVNVKIHAIFILKK